MQQCRQYMEQCVCFGSTSSAIAAMTSTTNWTDTRTCGGLARCDHLWSHLQSAVEERSKARMFHLIQTRSPLYLRAKDMTGVARDGEFAVSIKQCVCVCVCVCVCECVCTSSKSRVSSRSALCAVSMDSKDSTRIMRIRKEPLWPAVPTMMLVENNTLTTNLTNTSRCSVVDIEH